MKSLSDVHVGETAVVVKILGEGALRRRSPSRPLRVRGPDGRLGRTEGLRQVRCPLLRREAAWRRAGQELDLGRGAGSGGEVV